MYDFLRKLLSEPLYATMAVLIIWFLLYLTLIRTKLIKKKTWLKFEYFWIAVGFLGLLTIIAENKKQYKEYQLSMLEICIKNDYEYLSNSLDYRFPCMQFQNTGIFSQEEFDRRQARADSLCNWSKQVQVMVDSAIRKGNVKIDKISGIHVESFISDSDYQDFISALTKITEQIDQREKLSSDLGNVFWNEFKSSFGILLLFIAFGLRLAIITQKISEEK